MAGEKVWFLADRLQSTFIYLAFPASSLFIPDSLSLQGSPSGPIAGTTNLINMLGLGWEGHRLLKYDLVGFDFLSE